MIKLDSTLGFGDKNDNLKDITLFFLVNFMLNGEIYRILNKINGKSYIGQTTRDLSIRMNEHRNQSIKGSKYKACKGLTFSYFKGYKS